MINKTQLNIPLAEERKIVHRDYIAHCLRWSHILKNSSIGETILDLGCGDAQLAWTFYTNKYKPKQYVGIDLRDSIINKNKQIKFNFTTQFICSNVYDSSKIPQLNYSIITCLEVIEHNERDDGINLLNSIQTLMKPDTTLYVSTPCFNGEKAANHVYEWNYEELKSELEHRFIIESVNGTFISQRDFLEVANSEHVKVFNELKSYYDSNLLSIIFAPLYPEKSRNCIWQLKVKN